MKNEKISETRVIRMVRRMRGTVKIVKTDNGAIVNGGIGTIGITLTFGNPERTYLVADRADCNDWIRDYRSL